MSCSHLLFLEEGPSSHLKLYLVLVVGSCDGLSMWNVVQNAEYFDEMIYMCIGVPISGLCYNCTRSTVARKHLNALGYKWPVVCTSLSIV